MHSRRLRPPYWVLLVLILALLAPACAVGMTQVLPPVIMQRHDQDCLIASLAMLGGWSYDEVEVARRVMEVPFVTAGGVVVHEGLRIAATLGTPMVYLPPPTLGAVPSPRGILVVTIPGVSSGHAVLIDRDYIFDPKIPYAMPWVLWFHQRPEATVLGIIVVVP